MSTGAAIVKGESGSTCAWKGWVRWEEGDAWVRTARGHCSHIPVHTGCGGFCPRRQLDPHVPGLTFTQDRGEGLPKAGWGKGGEEKGR